MMSVLHDDVLMDQWKNSQKYKSFEIDSHYQDIYDWISPFNKPSDLWFILPQQSIGGNEHGKFGHLTIFASLKHLMILLTRNFFQGFIFTHYLIHW